MNNEDVMNLFDSFSGKDGKHEYRCNKCNYEMEIISVKTVIDMRKLFFCKNNKCGRFGILTVVAKIKDK